MTDGERWTRQELGKLATGGYRPSVWFRFVRASFERASLDRKARPAATRQLWTVAASGVIAHAVWAWWAPGVAAWSVAWWGLVVVMAIWHVGMVETPDGLTSPGLGIPNVLSLVRLGLGPAILTASPRTIAVLVVAAVATDMADGFVARRRGPMTRLGRWLDGSADSVVNLCAVAALWTADVVPLWVGALVAARHALQWLAVACWYFTKLRSPPIVGRRAALVSGWMIPAGAVLAALDIPAGSPLLAAGAGTSLVVLAAMVRSALAETRSLRYPDHRLL